MDVQWEGSTFTCWCNTRPGCRFCIGFTYDSVIANKLETMVAVKATDTAVSVRGCCTHARPVERRPWIWTRCCCKHRKQSPFSLHNIFHCQVIMETLRSNQIGVLSEMVKKWSC